MSKMSIKWHQECLKNLMQSQLQDAAELGRMQDRVNRTQARIESLGRQIERALREGRDGFDEDKYQPKKKREAN